MTLRREHGRPDKGSRAWYNPGRVRAWRLDCQQRPIRRRGLMSLLSAGVAQGNGIFLTAFAYV
jgi:hypothetical protein